MNIAQNIHRHWKATITFFDRFFKPQDWLNSFLHTHHIQISVPVKKGMMIDDYYTLAAILENKSYIKGKVLLIASPDTSKDIIDNCGDDVTCATFKESDEDHIFLNDISKYKDASFDTVISLFTLNNTYDYLKVMREIARVTRPSGFNLYTVCSIATLHKDYLWGFTTAAVGYMCEMAYKNKPKTLSAYGNVLSGRLLVDKVAARDVKIESLKNSDMYFPVVVSLTVKK